MKLKLFVHSTKQHKGKQFLLNKEIFKHLIYASILYIDFNHQIVEPCPVDAKPSPGAALFATEPENEITITVFAEG